MYARLTPLVAAGAPALVWSTEPGILAPLAIAGVLYARGVSVLWSHDAHRGVRPWQGCSFGLGWIVLALALLSPLHAASEQLFSAHMVQHELLMVLAAPLIVLGKPATVMLWALPDAPRHALGRMMLTRSLRGPWRMLSRPFDAWLIHGIVIWAWHVPVFFQTTLHSDAAHALQHASFMGSAMLFWWAIGHPRRRASLGLSVIYLFTTAIHTATLGALLTFARQPWFPEYAGQSLAWGLTPMEDQQLAGMIMWIPAGLVYLIAALLIARRWLHDSEWRVARDECAVSAS